VCVYVQTQSWLIYALSERLLVKRAFHDTTYTNLCQTITGHVRTNPNAKPNTNH